MCEVLLRVVSKSNPSDTVRDAKLTKRGDVIMVKPDGWEWSPRELTNPDWRILKLPNISVTEMASFLAPEPETTPEDPSPIRQRRAFRVDAGSVNFSAPIRNWINDDTRAQPTRTFNFDFAQLLAFRIAVQPLPRTDTL